MFDYLFETIFPFVGDFFGKLGALASITIGDLHSLVSGVVGYLPISYTNAFTGVSNTWELFFFGNNILGTISEVMINIVFVGQSWDTPLWVALLLSCVTVFILMAFISFIRSILPRLIPS